MVNISNLLINSCLHLNIAKTVCMFFQSLQTDLDPEIIVAGRRLSVVHKYKDLGIITDSQITFKE